MNNTAYQAWSTLYLQKPNYELYLLACVNLAQLVDSIKGMRNNTLLTYLAERAESTVQNFDDTVEYHIARYARPDLHWNGVHPVYYYDTEEHSHYGCPHISWSLVFPLSHYAQR